MPTYHQILTWKEEDHGRVTATVVISDDYDNMYGDLTEKSTEISCIIIDKVSKSIKDLSGGAEQRELKMIIDEALSNPQDAQAISFIKSAENISNIIFVALFIDTALDDIDPSSMIFNGVLQSNIEADDLLWHDNHFGKDINPKRRLKLTAKPYDMSVLAKFSMYDLIYGNDAQNVPGIDSTWEEENVKSRIAGFKWTEGITRGLYINRLVNFNDLLRKITDNLETAISNNNLGDINIKYSSSKVTGKWHHAKWNFERYKSFLLRFLHTNYSTKRYSPFRVLKNATNELYINPDGKPENFDLDAEGKHNNVDTYLWLKRSPWVSYRRIKYYDDEPSAEQWKEFRYSSICKDFPAFITQIASELGMFVKFHWSAGNTLNIKFYERNMSNFKVVKLKSATKAVIQPTSSNLERLKNTADKVNVANYYAVEGADAYSYDNSSDNTGTRQSPSYLSERNADKNIPILSLSPTTVRYFMAKEVGYKFFQVYFPHNYAMSGVYYEPYIDVKSVTTALYLYVDNVADEPDDVYAPSSFWSSAAAMSVNIEGEDRYYYTLSEFQRYISGIDINATMYEYSLDLPFLYCASYDDEVSWKHFDLLNYLQLDNTWYTIVAYEIDLKNVVVKLTLQSTSRFSFQNPELTGDMPSIPYTVVAETNEDNSNKIIVGKEVEGVSHLDFVAMLDDGTIIKAVPQRLLYHKLLGFAIVSGDILRYIQTSGVIADNDLPDYPVNTLIHLRYSDDSINISDTGLTTSNGAEDMICILGKYVDEKTIEIDDGYPHRVLLAPFNPE